MAAAAGEAMPFIVGCLGCKGTLSQFKLEPTWTYFLSVFWPVIDLTGDTLSLMTKLLSAEIIVAVADGPLDHRVLVFASALSIICSSVFLSWRLSYLRRMHQERRRAQASELQCRTAQASGCGKREAHDGGDQRRASPGRGLNMKFTTWYE